MREEKEGILLASVDSCKLGFRQEGFERERCVLLTAMIQSSVYYLG